MKVRLTEQVAIRMSAELRLKLEKRAKKEKRKVTEMGRLIIEEALNNPP